jgi:hypothetical protein
MQGRPDAHLLAMSAALLGTLIVACSAADRPATAITAGAAPGRCLPDAAGFLRAQLRGAINVDLDWRDAQIHCEGGPRPDGEGLRVSIAGPLPASAGGAQGRTLRFVFGIKTAAATTQGSALATNLTAIVEGGALYATRGDDKCTVDTLQRREVPGSNEREFRVDARGFCLGPASSMDGAARLLVTTFDFAGRVTFDP